MRRILRFLLVCLVLQTACGDESNAPLGEFETFIRYYGGAFNQVAVQVKEVGEGDIVLLSNTEISSSEFKISLTITDRFGHTKAAYQGPSVGSYRASSFITASNGNFIITGDEMIDGISYLMLLEIGASGNEVRRTTFNTQPTEISEFASVKGTGMTWGANNNLLIISNVSNNGAENMLLQSINPDWTISWSRAYGSDDGSWQSPSGSSNVVKRLYLNTNNSVVWGGTVGKNAQADFRLTAAPKNSQNPEFDLPLGTPNTNEEAFDLCSFGGGYVIVGRTELQDGTSNIKLVRTAENGAIIFENSFGKERNDAGKSVTPTRDGSLIVFGSSQTQLGNNSYYLVKLNSSSGEIIWEQIIGSSHNEEAADVIEGSDGSFIACGTTDFGGRKVAMLMKTTSEGKIF
jgi:hypothetical protein